MDEALFQEIKRKMSGRQDTFQVRVPKDALGDVIAMVLDGPTWSADGRPGTGGVYGFVRIGSEAEASAEAELEASECYQR